MNRVQPENVHSTIFTPREYQVELVDASLRGNTLSVLAASRSTRTFLITMVTREKAHQIRSDENGGIRKLTLITGWSGPHLVQAGEAIQQNTNLAVSTFTDLAQVQQWPDKQQRWMQVFQDCQVMILTVEVLAAAIEEKVIPLEILNLLVITDAHKISTCETLTKVVTELGAECAVMGLTSPVLSHNASPPQLDSFLSHLQEATRCRVDTASEVLTVLRFVNKPMEKIIMCSEPDESSRAEVEEEVRKLISDAISFLELHRYDLVEIYGPEYREFCQDIPDPKQEPIEIMKDFMEILDDLGLWCADRAALYALVEIEKLKRKTAYDRHYLLLCMIFSVMAKIRAIVEQTFDKYSELDQIVKFSSPKVLRLIEILRQIRPLNFVDPRKRREKLDLLENGRTEGFVPNKGSFKENVQFDPEEEDEDMDMMVDPIEQDMLLAGASCSDTDSETEEPKVKDYVSSKSDNGPIITDYISSESDDEPKISDYISSDSDDQDKDKAKCKVMGKHKKNVVEKSDNSDNESCTKTEDQSVLEDSLCGLSISDESKKTNESCDKNTNSLGCDDKPVVENEIPNSKECETNSPAMCNGYQSTEDNKMSEDEEKLIGSEDIKKENKGKDKTSTEITSNKENNTTSNGPSGLSAEAVALADTLAQLLPGGGLSTQRTRKPRGRDEIKEKVKVHNPDDPDSVCGLVFVRHRNVAKIIYRLLKELSDIGGDFAWIFPQYTVESKESIKDDQRAAEAEHKKQEEVLRRFRHHECNLLVSTRVLEEGIDVPQCNLVLRFDPSSNYRSYVNSLGRVRGLKDNFYLHLVTCKQETAFLRDMATYHAFHQVLMSRSPASLEEPTDKEVTFEEASVVAEPFITPAGAKVTITTAIGLLNKYCAKLPSDTFTRLTAMWEMEEKDADDKAMCEKEQNKTIGYINSSKGRDRIITRPEMLYRCSIMLPINSPLKTTIKGLWLPKVSLAKMSAALETCKTLHRCGELDDQLLPVGKESMRLDDHLAPPPPDDNVPQGMPRPGTTKRRQYYYKKVAQCLTGEQPQEGVELYVYKLNMDLTCPIPDEQNTRGRKIYRPEQSSRSFGLVTTKPISQVSAFPVFTRSGEVVVSLKVLQQGLRITQAQLGALQCFHKFTFTHVLRLEKYPIKFDPTNARTAFYIVPLNKNISGENIDWSFVEMIRAECDPRPVAPSEDSRKNFKFNDTLYEDAVVMPWYRNQDQPQYFYVAEICDHLNPQSDFPDAGFETFEKYYLTKYGLQISNISQPLLDVDHTSGRLNLLTPRHVNRKGVALPTTSEETKKAKRENLQQKQILVPELCTIHPFPASLWRKAVCLPTILYRINALLIADQLRLQVATQVGLGLATLSREFTWPQLDFGWCLADVLKKNEENSEESNKNKDSEKIGDEKDKTDSSKGTESGKLKNDKEDGLEIGTWSNDMAINPPTPPPAEIDQELDFEIDTFDPNVALPDNLTMIELHSDDDNDGELGADWGTGLKARNSKKKDANASSGGMFRVGSPSNFEGDVWEKNKGNSNTAGGGGNKWQYSSSSNGYGDFQGLTNGLDGCDSDLSSDMDDDDDDDDEDEDKEEDSSWEEENNKHHGGINGLGNDDDRAEDEEIDLQWPGEDLEQMQKADENFQTLLTDKQEEIKDGPMYLAPGESLVIEKTHRKEGYVPKVTAGMPKNIIVAQVSETADTNAGESSQGCDVTTTSNNSSVKGCDNTNATTTTVSEVLNNAVTNATSSPTKLVNREATLSLTKAPVNSDSKSSGVMSLCRNDKLFSFDYQPDLLSHPGPSPSVILQALTMSNANDGVNLERLETIGDSFLKYAITTFLYCTYPQRHEGKLSYLRSKQVSNLNLYRLGKCVGLGECMVATKFEPHDNWLPPGYFVPRELEEALIDSGVPAGHWNMADLPGLHDLPTDQIRRLVQERSEQIKASKAEALSSDHLVRSQNPAELPIFIPYNLLTQHSIPDKSIADCVEALIGAYLTTCGPRGALLFMTWLGISVLPCEDDDTMMEDSGNVSNTVVHCTYGHLSPPQSPLSNCPDENAQVQLTLLLSGYNVFEEKIGYKFRDQSYLLQAFTHASYYKNRLTDCYQRLEFLGDAVLDYLITRHLYEDRRQHSPGALTDLRSALVNNTIFASLAVKYDFHKYFRHFSPGLDRVVRDFVKMQEENGHKINEEYYFMEEDECEAAEDIEVPKALGDVFESVAGAIFLDSGASLDAVWAVYHNMMAAEIEQFSGVVPKSPIRELLEMEPETAKFGKPERLVDGKVRVSVEIFGKGSFSGVGRNYRIAKSTAAKRALRHLKKMQMMANLSNP